MLGNLEVEQVRTSQQEVLRHHITSHQGTSSNNRSSEVTVGLQVVSLKVPEVFFFFF